MQQLKPYFPLCLGNGLDSIMVDYSGSMHCDSGHLHLEQHGGAICCWEKISHRTRKRGMVPMAQFPYRIVGDEDELFEVGSFKQDFDPKTGILSTDIESFIVKMHIKTFITGEGLYVENYTITWVRKGARPSLIFYGRVPKIPHISLKHPAIDKINMLYDYKKKNIAVGIYSFEDIKGSICMGIDTRKIIKIDDKAKDIASIEVANILKGDQITRYVSMQDNSHSANFKKAAGELIDKAIKNGYEKIKNRHETVWTEYYSVIDVELPDNEMQKIYDTSLWLMRASQNQDSGFTVEGLYDAFKRGGHLCHWDTTFIVRAWVTSNLRDSVKKVFDFYQSGLKIARKYASQLGKEGAYYPWMTNHESLSTYYENSKEMPGIQKWNNCCMLIQLFDVYRYWSDKEELKKRLPLIKEILDFLISEIVEERNDEYFIKEIQGADENIDRSNDTAHLLSLIQGLKGYIEGCSILGLSIEKNYKFIFTGLKKALQGNIRNGIIYPWKEADRLNSASFTYDMFCHPEGISKENITYIFKASQGMLGLTNPGTYRNLIWPWTEVKAAISFATIDPKITYQRLKHVVKFTSSHGIFPEKIRPDGFWILFGYLSAHAGYVYALNSMLASDNGKTLFVAAGIPKKWENLKFSNIYTASGLGVSFEMKRGRIKKLILENTRDTEKKITIRMPNKKIKCILKPGRNVLIQEEQ